MPELWNYLAAFLIDQPLVRQIFFPVGQQLIPQIYFLIAGQAVLLTHTLVLVQCSPRSRSLTQRFPVNFSLPDSVPDGLNQYYSVNLVLSGFFQESPSFVVHHNPNIFSALKLRILNVPPDSAQNLHILILDPDFVLYL